MKSKVVKLAFLAMLMVGAGSFTNTASAQVYVSVRPVWHPVVRPVAPSPRHVWIDEEWAWRNGAYVPVGGYWGLPPHPGWIWYPGHWNHGTGVTAGMPDIGDIVRDNARRNLLNGARQGCRAFFWAKIVLTLDHLKN